MRHITILIFLLTASLTLTECVYPYSSKTESLSELIEEALSNNPAVRESYENWRAAIYRIDQSLSLPDPMAKYTFFGENVETRVGPQEYKIGASQKVPLPVKLGTKGKIEARHAGMLKERYEAAGREIIKQIKFVYYDIFWVDKAIEVTEEEKDILNSLEKVATRKYESNLAPVQDSVKAGVEISRLIDKLYLLRQNRKSLEAKAISILARPEGSEFGRVEPVRYPEFHYGLQDLHTIAGESRQELLAAKLNIERAEYEKSLAQFDYLPDVTLGFEYIGVGKGHTTQPNDGQDAWMGSVAINVPIWLNRLDAQFKEKRASLESSRERYRDVKNAVYYEIEDVYFKINAYKDIIVLYETALISQTEQAFEAAKTGYETGKVDFLNWLDSERTLLQTRLAYYKAITDYLKSIAYLERVVGRDL